MVRGPRAAALISARAASAASFWAWTAEDDARLFRVSSTVGWSDSPRISREQRRRSTPTPQRWLNRHLSLAVTHAAALAVSVPASRARDALLGGTSQAEDSFPRTEVRHLDPIRIFRAAFWSRSCDSPQSLHTHDLTINPLTPRGPLRAPQVEQVTLVFRSLMTANVLVACWLL